MADFLEIIQSSEEEIYDYLNYIEAYKINGKNSNTKKLFVGNVFYVFFC